jgi:hypothetical protein
VDQNLYIVAGHEVVVSEEIAEIDAWMGNIIDP